MIQLRRSIAVAAMLAAVGAAPGAAFAGMSSTGVASEEPREWRQPRDAAVDPLAMFHLSLDLSSAQLGRVSAVEHQGRLRAKGCSYDYFTLPARLSGEISALPAPLGVVVLDGSFFFAEGGRLVEASLLLGAAAGPEHALRILERELGAPSFEVVLPGAMYVIAGWRTPSGYVLATFSDLDLFQVSVFRDEATDLLAGGQIMLFNALSEYSRALAGGASLPQLARELMKVVNTVGAARSNLEPVR